MCVYIYIYIVPREALAGVRVDHEGLDAGAPGLGREMSCKPRDSEEKEYNLSDRQKIDPTGQKYEQVIGGKTKFVVKKKIKRAKTNKVN